MSILGSPPASDAGEMSPLTKLVRPPLQLEKDHCMLARRMRRAGKDVHEIAAELDTTDEAVIQALAPMRMPNTNASRATLNVTLAARDFVISHCHSQEPIWMTMDRLLVDYAMLRAEVLALRAMKGGSVP